MTTRESVEIVSLDHKSWHVFCVAEEGHYLQVEMDHLGCGCAGRRLQHFGWYCGMVIFVVLSLRSESGFGGSICYLLLHIPCATSDIRGGGTCGSLGVWHDS